MSSNSATSLNIFELNIQNNLGSCHPKIWGLRWGLIETWNEEKYRYLDRIIKRIGDAYQYSVTVYKLDQIYNLSSNYCRPTAVDI